MIPTMVVFGLVFGRWWHATLLASPFFWVGLLLISRIEIGFPQILVAGLLGLANASAGVVIHQAFLQAIRLASEKWWPSPEFKGTKYLEDKRRTQAVELPAEAAVDIDPKDSRKR